MMVTMPHGDTSSYAVTQARSQEPTLRRSVTPTSRSATLTLPSFPDGSQLAATLRPQGLSLTQATWKHSHCKACRALHFGLPGFQRLISQWKRLPVVLHVCLPCSRPCDHVANIWPVGGKQRSHMAGSRDLLKSRWWAYFALFFGVPSPRSGMWLLSSQTLD